MTSATLALAALALAPADQAAVDRLASASPTLFMMSEVETRTEGGVSSQESEPDFGDIDLAAPKPFPDPLEDINRISYAVSQPIDRIILRPIAMTYKAVVPKPLRDGARNVINNAGEPVVFANDLLQLRPDRAFLTLFRFLINSTVGAFGLFDIAKRAPVNLPRRSNGFGNTLGTYGIGPIAYIYLPVLGPNTLRDFGAGYADGFVRDPLIDKAIYPKSGRRLYRDSPDLGTAGTAIMIVEGLDMRAEFDAELRSMTEDSIDPYAALRANFLQDRAGDIAALKARDGVAPAVDGFNDPLLDPEVSDK